jgi:hypothetical protein
MSYVQPWLRIFGKTKNACASSRIRDVSCVPLDVSVKLGVNRPGFSGDPFV